MSLQAVSLAFRLDSSLFPYGRRPAPLWLAGYAPPRPLFSSAVRAPLRGGQILDLHFKGSNNRGAALDFTPRRWRWHSMLASWADIASSAFLSVPIFPSKLARLSLSIAPWFYCVRAQHSATSADRTCHSQMCRFNANAVIQESKS